MAAPTTGGTAFPWRAFVFVGPLAFLFMAVFYVIPTQGPFLLGDLGVESPLGMGAVMAIMTLFSLPGALSYGRLRQRLSMMAIFALSWALMGVGMGIVALAPSVLVAAMGVAMMGLGMGPSMPNYTTFWMATVPPGMRGRAAGSGDGGGVRGQPFRSASTMLRMPSSGT